MNSVLASVLSYGAVAVAQYAGGKAGPTPANPRTALWYACLTKPGFTPPGPVFGGAWTLLDALLGYTGYRLFKAPNTPARTAALSAWSLNVLGVGGFSWVLFGRKRLGAATCVSAAMVASSIGSVATAARVDRRAAFAGLPLAVWTCFALVLQEQIWRRN